MAIDTLMKGATATNKAAHSYTWIAKPIMPSERRFISLLDEERILVFAHCARHHVGFLSEANEAFYGSGVLASLDGRLVIVTAAHVINAIHAVPKIKIVFPGHRTTGGARRPVEVRDFESVLSRVTDDRQRRDWDPSELDLGVVIPTPSVFEGISSMEALKFDLYRNNGVEFEADRAIVCGFPSRLQTDRSNREVASNMVIGQFVGLPSGTRGSDIALSWAEIYQASIDQFEDAPNAEGMSGGPAFFYVREVQGVWSPASQLQFAGIVHYQLDGDAPCLLIHHKSDVEEFLRESLADNDFACALSQGAPAPL